MNVTGGIYNGRRIKTPDEKIVRPTLSKVRMGVFNTLFSILGDFERKSFLDMFGGSGIMGLEAISRGFEKVLVLEKNKTVAEIIKTNYKSLGLVPNLLIGDSVNILQKNSEKYDVIYVDPPYSSGIYENVLNVLKSKSDAIAVLEHNAVINFSDFVVLKQKKYGDKYLTFIKL